MSQGRDVGVVKQAAFLQEEVGDALGHRGGEHGADVDGHVEQAERGVTLRRVLRVVVEVAHHDLQVALEQARADGYQRQCAKHQHLACDAGFRGDGQAQVACKHHADAQRDTLAEPYLVGKDAAEQGHEIHGSEENGINLRGNRRAEAELRLDEQQEDGEHGVVTETLARVGKRQGVEPLRLSFKHIASIKLD